MANDEQNEKEVPQKCPECGELKLEVEDDNSVFCEACGYTSLNLPEDEERKQESRTPPQPPQEEKSAEQESRSPPNPEEDMGAQKTETEIFTDHEEKTDSTPAPEPEEEVYYECPNCGAEILEDDDFCEKCGVNFEQEDEGKGDVPPPRENKKPSRPGKEGGGGPPPAPRKEKPPSSEGLEEPISKSESGAVKPPSEDISSDDVEPEKILVRKEEEEEEEESWFEEKREEYIKPILKIERQDPHYSIMFSFFVLGILGASFLPFYPWWMVIMFGAVSGLVAAKFQELSLILVALISTGSVAYQAPEFALVFLLVSIAILGASLFDWKFGALVFLTVFLAPYGISFLAPIGAAIIYSTFLGVAVATVGGIFISLFLTLGHFQSLGLLFGPLTGGEKTLVAGHSAPLKGTIGNFDFLHIVEAYGQLGNLNEVVFQEGIANLSGLFIPLLQVIGIGFAVLIASKLGDKSATKTIKDWFRFSTLAGAVISLTVIGAAFYYQGTPDLLIISLALGAFGSVYTATGSGLIIKDWYSGYFTSQAGETDVGSRVAEMEDLGETTFEDVGGLDSVKEDIYESLVTPLTQKNIAEEFGVDPPTGVLMFGAPGCGKTLMMKALANELNVEMISVKCSDVMSKWYGESEQRIAKLFAAAKQRAPCILFLDEIESLAKERGSYASDDVTGRLLSIMLSELDGLESEEKMIVVGSTNKPNMLDPALLRPGRLDKIIYVPPPDFESRVDILRIHLMDKPVDPRVDLAEIAKETERFSGADLANLCNEAATRAMTRAMKTQQQSAVTQEDFEEIIPKIKPSIKINMIKEYEQAKKDFERRMHESESRERKKQVSFEDVGGLEDIKEALHEYVELPLTNPDLFEKYEMTTGKGMLLFGPPGCGKTHVMRAASNELDVTIQIVNGPELVSGFAGESEKKIREIMNRGRENAPAIIFFDEIDSLASKESMETAEVSRAVSQFLTEMDGMEGAEQVMIVGTTNRPQKLDPAILRPGRLDKIFYVPPPGHKARDEIFRIHLRDIPVKGDIDYENLATRTEGYTGADIASIVEDAKLIAIRDMVKGDREFQSEDDKEKELERHLKGDGRGPTAGVTMDDILEAYKNSSSSLTDEVLEWSREFMEEYGTRT
ncbi:MAG: AAA family ATPase [Candidatus Thermoplasmatota archaeon]|nr:AAA family ATPase [Candidatus Thermoplasmatota archaeon]